MNIDDDKYPRVNSGVVHKVVPADAIVIERDGLPRVVYDGRDYYVDGHAFPPDWGVEDARAAMRANAAMLVYLRANPSVDEATL